MPDCSQEFISTLLFVPSMPFFLSYAHIRVYGLGCSHGNRERELGLDRRETGWFYPTIRMMAWKQSLLIKDRHLKSRAG